MAGKRTAALVLGAIGLGLALFRLLKPRREPGADVAPPLGRATSPEPAHTAKATAPRVG